MRCQTLFDSLPSPSPGRAGLPQPASLGPLPTEKCSRFVWSEQEPSKPSHLVILQTSLRVTSFPAAEVTFTPLSSCPALLALLSGCTQDGYILTSPLPGMSAWIKRTSFPEHPKPPPLSTHCPQLLTADTRVFSSTQNLPMFLSQGHDQRFLSPWPATV